MDLLSKQFVFSSLIARLILYAIQQRYQVTLGEAWRSPETAALYAKEGKGIVNSLHCQRLAMDLNLFQNGKLLTDSAQYLEIGKYWETFSTTNYQCSWGGNFSKPDGNHFSIEYNGVK